MKSCRKNVNKSWSLPSIVQQNNPGRSWNSITFQFKFSLFRIVVIFFQGINVNIKNFEEE